MVVVVDELVAEEHHLPLQQRRTDLVDLPSLSGAVRSTPLISAPVHPDCGPDVDPLATCVIVVIPFSRILGRSLSIGLGVTPSSSFWALTMSLYRPST